MSRTKNNNNKRKAVIQSFCFSPVYQPQIDKIKEIAGKRGMSVSGMIMFVIADYLERGENNDDDNNKENKTTTGKIWVQ